MTERTITDATRIVIEKETGYLNDLVKRTDEILNDENYSPTYKQAAVDILQEEASRIHPKGPVPED